ncbi:MAG: DUF2726 domain-containing protein [Verrucomicrobiota bacterium]|jgi:hypothetical protein|nr:DUF2726 domain-containing protein [Verrucomicrobiota bacterium]
MKSLLFLMTILISIRIVLAILSGERKKRENGQSWPFYARPLLTRPEQVLFWRLKNVFPDHIVLAQVSLGQILRVKKGYNFGGWYNRINRMSADFVICRQDASVACVIELDDASHTREDRWVADAKKEKALSSAGVRLFRYPVKVMPSEEILREQFSFLLGEPSLPMRPGS